MCGHRGTDVGVSGGRPGRRMAWHGMAVLRTRYFVVE